MLSSQLRKYIARVKFTQCKRGFAVEIQNKSKEEKQIVDIHKEQSDVHDYHDDHHDLHDDHHDDHHHHKEYDWRDDPKHNPDLYLDARDVGWDPTTYKFPYEGKDDWIFPAHSVNYNPDDVSINLRPENKPFFVNYNTMRAPYWDPEHDIAHEYDYESEDLDFQAEDFKMQHFRKKGPIWPYFILGNLALIYFWLEWIFQHFPDEDHYRVSRAPPLDYPDPEDTDDTTYYQEYHSRDGRELRETGIVSDIWYDVVDGKKIYRKYAGCGPQMDDI